MIFYGDGGGVLFEQSLHSGFLKMSFDSKTERNFTGTLTNGFIEFCLCEVCGH
jgi:hypothetical protein